MSQESKTPRTDAAWTSVGVTERNLYRLACELELELSAVTEERDAFIASARIKEANSGWRPIETAPKDGSRIMVANTHGAWFAEWLETYASGLPARYWFSTMLAGHHKGTDMTIEPVQVVEIVKLFGKKVWIESDFFGAKHVMVQHDAPGEEPFCYASFHYDYSHTSNSGVMQEATRVAMALGAVEPIECRNRGWPDNSQSEGVGLVIAAEKLAPWMSAALEDPSVCAEMKADAESFLEALDRVRNG